MKAPLTALLVVFASSCLLAASEPKTRPKTVLIIRHAEKPAGDDDIHLSPEGKKRAEALPKLFQKSDDRPKPFPTPEFIFATKKSMHSNRPVETVVPLAEKLELKVNSAYEDDEFAKLVEHLYSDSKYDGKTVLICWHHGKIPELASTLGATKVPDKWKSSVFDQVWVVTFDENGKAKPLAIRQQALMPGDAKE